MRRILSIDGGGIRGVFPAAFLANLEKHLPSSSVGDYFDLIVGTSTGGIIALGLGLGLSAEEILQFYHEYGPDIFRGNRSWYRTMRQWLRGKYDSKPLRKALEATFGSKKLGDSTKRLVVPSLNLVNGEPYIYKTAHHTRLRNDYKEPVIDVALATSAAPTYFPLHHSSIGVDLIDGGIYAGNPTGMAVAEAIGVLGWQAAELLVLSVGCTSTPFADYPKSNIGFLQLAKPAVSLFMRGQSHASMGIAYVLLDHTRVVRIDPSVPPNKMAMDNSDNIEFFDQLGATVARHEFPKLEEVFFMHPADPFDPIYAV